MSRLRIDETANFVEVVTDNRDERNPLFEKPGLLGSLAILVSEAMVRAQE